MEQPYSIPDAVNTPPHNRAAEISVLGSMIQDPSALDIALETLVPLDFYAPENQDIFACMVSLRQKGAPVDTVSVAAELDRLGKLRAVGDAGYLVDLTIQTPSTANVAHYASVVQERSLQRQLIRAGNEISRDAQDIAKDWEAVIADAERRIYDISLRQASDTLRPVQESMYDVYDELGEMMNNKDKLVGVPTGFIDLDSKTSGLKKSDLVIIAGRPSMGKTSFALNIAGHAALHAGRSVAVFSLEMSRDQLINRLFSFEAEVNMSKMLTGGISVQELTKISAVLDPMGQSRLFIDDAGGVTVPEMRSKCRRLKARQGLDLIVIDYLQLMHSPRKTDNRQQEISEITRSLKQLARDIDVPVLLLSQLSRAPETRKDSQDGHRPMLSDLRESGAIEQDADIVLLLYRDQVYNDEADNVAEVNIAKHRNGETGIVKLCWLGEYTKFKNLAR